MSTHQYIQYLEQPELIGQLDKDTIHQWVDTYPATPIFRVMLAAKYQSEQHPDTASYIEQAAFYVQNRKELKYLLRDWQEKIDAYEITPIASDHTEKNEVPTLSDSTNVEEEVAPEDQTAALSVEEDVEAISVTKEVEQEEVKVDDEADIETDLTETVKTESPLIEEITEEEERLPEAEPVADEHTETPEPAVSVPIEEALVAIDDGITEEDDIAFLKAIGKYEAPVVAPIISISEEEDLSAPGKEIHVASDTDVIDSMLAISDADILLPWVGEFTIPTKIFDQPEQPLTVHPEPSTQPTQKAQAEEPIEDKKESISESQPETSTASTKGKYSFDEWLNILEQKKQHPEDAPVFDLPTPEVFNQKEIEAAKAADQKPIAPLSASSKTDHGDEVVKQLASNSVSFKIDMATETLAKLYAKQGKNDKAINIYKKLIDKYPKKSSYFADQIENLK